MSKLHIAVFSTAVCSLILSAQIPAMPLSADMSSSVISISLPGELTTSSINLPDNYDLTLLCLKTSLYLPDAISEDAIKTKSSEITPKKSPAISPVKDPPSLPTYVIETEITKGGTSLSGVEINNATDYNLSDALNPVTIPDNPTVLIVHTHTSESYRPSDAYPYTPTDNSRTEDTNFNVARVGNELASSLSSYGINVIHDSSLNDYPSYNGSYKKTLELIESHLEKNPEIDMVIDLHRDAMERADGTVISTVCNVNGEKAAQVMLVVGTDQGGLTHQNWRDNFSFAVKLQTIINENFPHLARPVNVRSERFNGHTSPKELIIEVGTTGNTLDEALVSAHALAFAINEFYTG